VELAFLVPPSGTTDVRFGSEADICSAKCHVCFTPNSDRKSDIPAKVMSALPPKNVQQKPTSAMGQKRTHAPQQTASVIL